MNASESENLWWGYGLTIALACISLMISALSTDNGGREVWHHRDAMPEHVTLIGENSSDKYIIGPKAKVGPAAICKGGSADSPPVEEAIEVPQMDSTFIDCAYNQYWSSTIHESPNLGRSLILMIQHPGWAIPTGILLGLNTFYLMIVGWRVRGRNRASARRIKTDLEQTRRELVRSYAMGDLEDLHFHQAMDNLYAQGVKPAKD